MGNIKNLVITAPVRQRAGIKPKQLKALYITPYVTWYK